MRYDKVTLLAINEENFAEDYKFFKINYVILYCRAKKIDCIGRKSNYIKNNKTLELKNCITLNWILL